MRETKDRGDKLTGATEELFTVRQWDGMDGCWTDLPEACGVPMEQARRVWLERTDGGTRKIAFSEIDYYAIHPADTKMHWNGAEGREMFRRGEEEEVESAPSVPPPAHAEELLLSCVGPANDWSGPPTARAVRETAEMVVQVAAHLGPRGSEDPIGLAVAVMAAGAVLCQGKDFDVAVRMMAHYRCSYEMVTPVIESLRALLPEFLEEMRRLSLVEW